MPKRLGNTQISSAAGLSDIINLKQHKQYVEQDIFPSPDNDVLSGLRFDGSSYLSRVQTAGNRTTMTYSLWVKRSNTTAGHLLYDGNANDAESGIYFVDHRVQTEYYHGPSASYYKRGEVNYLRDLSSWYHLVFVIDTTNSNTAHQFRIYINSIETDYEVYSAPPGSLNMDFNVNGSTVYIGARTNSNVNMNGYLAEVNFIDGQALSPTDFGYYNRSTGQWKPKKYTGTYGANGFYLPFNTNVYRYFNGAASVNLSGSPITTFPCTVSCWVNLNDVGGTYGQVINLNVGGTRASIFYNYDDNGGFTGDQASTFIICIGLQNHFATENLRTYPNSGWHHLAVVFKSGTNVTPDVYIDGEFVSATNRGGGHGGTGVNAIGSNGSSAEYFSGYITNVAYFDNYTITQEEVTEIFNSGLDGDITTLSVTQPNSYLKLNEKTGTTVAATLGTITGVATNSMITNSLDFSGNHNDWTPIGFSGHDTVPDSPQNTFATLNPLFNSSISLSDGNLTTGTFLASADSVTSSMQVLSNDITYCEIYYETSYSNLLNIGLMENYNTSSSWGIRGDGEPWNNAPQTAVSISFTTGDVLGVIVDIQNSKWYLAKNGALQLSANISNGTGYIHNNLTSNLSLRCWNATNSGSQKIRINFGQDPTFGGAKSPTTTYTDANGIGAFYYQPPDGALALCTANLSRSVIEDPSKYMNSVTYTGSANSGTAGKKIKIGFQPDLIWAKDRFVAYYLQLHDTVRGSSGGVIYSNTTDTQDSTYAMQDFIGENQDGFTLGSNLTALNAQGSDIVAWCWKAGGAPSGATDTNGSAMIDGDAQKVDDIYANSTGADLKPNLMSVSTKAGFSIIKVSFSNTDSAVKIPHGLSKAPEWVMIKSLDQVTNWSLYHKSLGPTKRLKLNSVDLPETYTEVWNNTDPDQHVITIGNDSNPGTNWHGTGEQIIYAWHSVPGYSAFGSYTANNSSDNVFVYTGFSPAWLMIRAYEGGNRGFMVWDNKRETFGSPAVPPGANPAKSWLNAQATTLCTGEASQSKYGDVDILSNGFKIRNNNGNFGLNSEKHLWFAFAKNSINFTNSR